MIKKIICILGLSFGLCFTTVGVLLVTGVLNFAPLDNSIKIYRAETGMVNSYRFGADFYTEVSSGLYGINKSVNAVNETQISGFDNLITHEIEAATSTNKTIHSMFGLLEMTLGLFTILFFLMKLVSTEKIVQNE